MLNQVLRKKKLARKNRMRKDYERRRNINNNVPTDKFKSRKEVYRNTGKIKSDGHAETEHVGYKDIIVKRPHYRNHTKGVPHQALKDEYNRDIGMIAYPKKRKFTEKKSTKK